MTAVGNIDVIVLAGGTSRRWGGGDKLEALLRGRTLREWALAGAAELSDEPIVVGPEHGGGPLAAIAAVASQVRAERVWIVGADQPLVSRAAPAVRRALDAAPAEVAAAVAVARSAGAGGSGGQVTLGVMWRREALLARLAALAPAEGRPLRMLAEGCATVRVPVDDLWLRDCDTPADLAALDAELAGREG